MSKKQNDNNDNRIQEIIAELNDCREDERNSQNLIVQVLSTAGAILGVVCALSDNSSDKLALFFLNDVIFSTAFAFIITLGIGNVLRYYYIQDLEDRLSCLVSPGTDKGELVHWMSFSSPVTTRNPKHLNSKYSIIHFTCYAFATASAIIFSVLITFYQYKRLDTPSRLNEVALVLPAIFMVMSFFVFLYICIKAKDMYHYAMKNSILKKKDRIRDKRDMKKSETVFKREDRETEGNSSEHVERCHSSWFKAVVYFIYPKIKDLQKSSLILFGFVTGVFLFDLKIDMVIINEYGKRLFWTFIIMDVLLYQARYQWNDIRGLREDIALGKSDRLPVYILGKRPAVIVSLIILFAKICIAFFVLMRFGGKIKIPLFICMVLLILISVLYEAVRTGRYNEGIFFIVCLGYPLRILTGLCAAWPEICHSSLNILAQPFTHAWTGLLQGCNSTVYKCDMQTSQLLIIFLLIAFFFYGGFCVTIPWTCEALQQQYKEKRILKLHYSFLFEKVKDRIGQPKAQGEDDFYPLRRKGKLFDPWNTCYMSAMLSMSAGFIYLIYGRNLWYALFEILLIFFSALLCLAPKKHSLYSMIISLSLCIVKTIACLLFCSGNIWIIYIGIFQIFFLVSYVALRYYFDPNFHMLKLLLKIIIGKDTYDYLKED